MMFHQKLFWILVIWVWMIIPGGCKENVVPEKKMRPVKAIQVEEEEQSMTRIFPGKTEATQEANLAFRVPGQLQEFPVNVGQYIKKGDLIARLDPRDYKTNIRAITNSIDQAKAQLKAMETGAREEDLKALQAQLESAKAALQEAQLQFERQAALYQKGIVSKAVFDHAKAAEEAASANVERMTQELKKAKSGARKEEIEAMQSQIKGLQAKLETASSAHQDTFLKAPYDGYIAVKYVDNFENVGAGNPIIKIQDISRLEVTVGLPDDLIARKDKLVKAVCRLEAFPDREFQATIKEISTDVDTQTQTYPVTVIMDQPSTLDVLPGMAANVALTFSSPAESKNTGFVTPNTAVFSDDGEESLVWILDPETLTVTKRKITIGQITSKGIMVTSGLESGEWIVTAGVHFLQEGQQVRMLKQNQESKEVNK
jgi:multidrug efflux pump subunit AcrA (membrane-fusion protein)